MTDPYIATGSRIESRCNIGDWTRINGPILIKGSAYCTIGKYCAFGDDIHIITSNHGTNRACSQGSMCQRLGLHSLDEPAEVHIGHNVWMGDNVIVLPGVTIGNGAIIGAGAVVTKDVPAWSVALGNPAKVKRYRFEEKTREVLERVAWWDWDEDRIARNWAFFDNDLTRMKHVDIESLLRP